MEVRRWIPRLAAGEDLLIVENGRFLREDGDVDENGLVVAMVKVTAIRPFLPTDIDAACASYFEEGWYAWELSDIRPLSVPVKVLAAREIYEVDFSPPAQP